MTTKVSIYGCGGTGINLLRNYLEIPYEADRPLYPISTKHAFDTSESNLRDLEKGISKYLVPGMVGAGKKRLNAYSGAAPYINEALKVHKPGDINYVVFGAAGGSGSVLGPLIAAELLRRGAAVICFIVGSLGSDAEASNTLACLQTLQSFISNKKTGNRPIPFVYLENSPVFTGEENEGYRFSRSEVDKQFREYVRRMSILISGNHHELDHEDIINWLDYSRSPRTSTIPPQLVEIIPFMGQSGGMPTYGNFTLDALQGRIIGLASVQSDANGEQFDLGHLYNCEGFYDEAVVGETAIPNMYFITSTARVPHFFNSINKAVEDFIEIKEGLSSAAVCGVVESDEDGMVF